MLSVLHNRGRENEKRNGKGETMETTWDTGDRVEAKIMGKWRPAKVLARENWNDRITYTLEYADARGEIGYANKSARLMRAI